MTKVILTCLVTSLCVGCKALQLAPHPIPVVLPTDTKQPPPKPTTPSPIPKPTVKNQKDVDNLFFILEDWF